MLLRLLHQQGDDLWLRLGRTHYFDCYMEGDVSVSASSGHCSRATKRHTRSFRWPVFSFRQQGNNHAKGKRMVIHECKLANLSACLSSWSSKISSIVKLLELEATIVSGSAISSNCRTIVRLSWRDSGTHLLWRQSSVALTQCGPPKAAHHTSNSIHDFDAACSRASGEEVMMSPQCVEVAQKLWSCDLKSSMPFLAFSSCA
jgi:hypothetical protein